MYTALSSGMFTSWVELTVYLGGIITEKYDYYLLEIMHVLSPKLSRVFTV